jgi:hypothetical protein
VGLRRVFRRHLRGRAHLVVRRAGRRAARSRGPASTPQPHLLLEAQEFREAGQLLGAASKHVELVAVVANPVDYQIGYTRAFDQQEGLADVPNWLYLTGSLAQLQAVWRKYGIAADIEPAGAMIGHSEIAFAIDRAGRLHTELDFDPGPGTAATKSSFAAELTDTARQLLGRS